MIARTSRGYCHVCGGQEFEHTPVLWPELVAAWGLSQEEAGYIDIQQGSHCVNCGSNVRSIALARAILRSRSHLGPLNQFVKDDSQATLRVLEINEAGTLHPFLPANAALSPFSLPISSARPRSRKNSIPKSGKRLSTAPIAA